MMMKSKVLSSTHGRSTARAGRSHTRASVTNHIVQFRTSRTSAMSCGWEGNRRSGVALAIRHRLKWFDHQRAQGPSKGDENPTNTHHGVYMILVTVFSRVDSKTCPGISG